MVKVLIVEDDPMVAEINKKYTESINGFKVKKICDNGKDAINYLKNSSLDLIILDIYMPKLNGIEFLKELRKFNSKLDVIIVTAVDEGEKLKEILNLGVIDYLIKPFEYERFKEALNKFKKMNEFFKNKSILKQEDVDNITVKNSYVNGELEKGINERTLERVKKYLKNSKNEYYTSEEIADKMKLSRVTVRRYLEYMNKIGKVKRDVQYGDIGRPRIKYKLI